ncbi:haloacid dehalogenase [Zooshikella marina]|uniref:lipin/Ned1/Smp2 family protein n=1 Tax=Zooshikella ganghwensis TaxID=202772 RepID=UPI001BB00766|nr:haloacid dehalogenase [Zooshikella ganghwensis]MBU2708143.1 haloacid dehalogenase [Zooshikella ganghwensis]
MKLTVKLSLFISMVHTANLVANPQNQQVPPVIYDGCSAYDIAQSAPKLKQPSIKPFRHQYSQILSHWFKPFHMVHDVVANQNKPATITAKFDYDRVWHKDLEDEHIHAYLFGTGMQQWTYLGQYTTDTDGKIDVKVPGQKAGDYIVRMVVEGDGTTVDGFLNVRQPKHEAIVFDLDGTLTISDAEQVGDYIGIKTATPFYYAKETLQVYREKGYQLIFLTARPYWLAKDSRDWLRNIMAQSDWHLHTNENGELSNAGKGHREFKANYLKSLQDEKGIKIVRAYGNAQTDIQAYADAGISKQQTYILGKYAGDDNTQTVGDDYTHHFTTVVTATQEAKCKQK